MSKIKATGGAGKAFYLNHLSANDYYSEGEKVEGYWKGRLALDFGVLSEKVTADVFSLFQRNINPYTHGKLTMRNAANSVRFYDFQVAAPKSVSVMSLLDERLMEAHLAAVGIAMRELEMLAAVRVREGENVRTNNIEMTGKIVYAEFSHDCSQALDPQLHTHNVVCNVTKTKDGKFKALDSIEMCRAIRYAGKVYHNEMARRCIEMGYEIVNTLDEKGNIVWYDLKGVPEEIMEIFSKRRGQIEAKEAEFVAEHGRKPTLAENNFLSVSTRGDKLKNITSKEVKKLQKSQLSEAQHGTLQRVYNSTLRTHLAIVPLKETALIEMVREVIPLLYERESVLKLDKVLAETLNQNLGKINLSRLKKLIVKIPELRNLGGLAGNPYVSPQEVIDRELLAIELVETQRELFPAIAPEYQAFPGEETRAKQAELIHGMLNSKDRFMLFRGVAGAGKTSTLQELCKGLRSGNVNDIFLIAPTNSATDVLKQEGFEQSQTVASFLLSPQKPPEGSFVIIDESGLNSLREGVEILKTARANNYRVMFVGDARQHTAVESGDFFRLLEDYSEIEKFSLTDIYRQQNEEYRRGIMECALGQFEPAFERFYANGFIHEGKDNYLKNAAQSYMDYTDNGRNIDQAILVAPTHDEGDRLTEAVRDQLKAHGAVAQSGRQSEIFRSWNKPKAWLCDSGNYQAGTTIAFIRNLKGVAHAGETATVEAVADGMLHLDNGKAIYAQNAGDFIEVGEMRPIELRSGDLIQFNVNLRDRKIYNGNIARITDDPGKVMMLYANGKPRELIDLPPDYATFKYGWVTTSHKSQGRTSENVVVAAQSLDQKSFYVALSRGRKHLALHCPEKEFLKQQLLARNRNRTSVHDLIRDREIPAHAILPLSTEAQEVKAKTLPDSRYKSIKDRALAMLKYVKDMAVKLVVHSKKVAARRARHAKYGYGYGVVTEKTYFEQDINFAFEQNVKAAPETPNEVPVSSGVASLIQLQGKFAGNVPPAPKTVSTGTSVAFELPSKIADSAKAPESLWDNLQLLNSRKSAKPQPLPPETPAEPSPVAPPPPVPEVEPPKIEKPKPKKSKPRGMDI